MRSRCINRRIDWAVSLLILSLSMGCGGSTETPDMPESMDMAVQADVQVDMNILAPDEGVVCMCEADTMCNAAGECVQCSSDTECAEMRICVDSTCTDGCSEDADCTEALEGAFCNAGRCGQCRTDDDCFGESTCSESATCEEPDTCVDSRECRESRVCLNSVCADRPDCNQNFTCPVGQDCLADGTCVPGTGEGCQSNEACSKVYEVCLVQTRTTSCGLCETDDDCNIDHVACTVGGLAEGAPCLLGEEDSAARAGICRTISNQLVCVGDTFKCESVAGVNRCTEPSGCEVGGCLPNRICDRTTSTCVPEACSDDPQEDNDVLADAVVLNAGVYSDLVSCANDDDWYQFVIGAQQVATVQVRHLPTNINLTLVAYNADGREIERRQTNNPTEIMVLSGFQSESTVYFSVTQEDGLESNDTYTIQLDIAEAAACVPDAIDGSVGDDTIERARQVRASNQPGFDTDELSGTLCTDDPDVFCFHTNSRERLSVSARVSGHDSTENFIVKGVLTRPSGDVAAEGSWSSSGMDTDINFSTGAGQHCLTLTAEQSFGNYELSFEVVDVNLENICSNANRIDWPAANQITLDGTLSSEDEIQPLCAPLANGGEQLYEVVFGASDNLPKLVTARVTGSVGGTLGDPVLSVRRSCAGAASELACSTVSYDANDPTVSRVNPAQLKFRVDQPGSYFVIVDGRSVGANPDFRLQLNGRSSRGLSLPDLCPNDAAAGLPIVPRECDPNQTAAACSDEPGLKTANFQVALDEATDTSRRCAGLNGPEVYQVVEFEEDADVQVSVRGAPGQQIVAGVSLISACTDPAPIACGFGFETRVEAGRYFLVIEGVDRNSLGDVNVLLKVNPVGAQPANETCASAEVLPNSAGFVVGSTAAAMDDYALLNNNTCTGYDTRAPDVVYEFMPDSGAPAFVTARPIGGWDLSLYVRSDCADISSTDGRVACSEDGTSINETVVFDPSINPGPYFVVVDGSSSESGEFELTYGTVECVVSDDCNMEQTCDPFTYQCR